MPEAALRPVSSCEVLPSHLREEYHPSRPCRALTESRPAEGRRPYLKGVALHQRDVLLIYQRVLGLESNHISKHYLGDRRRHWQQAGAAHQPKRGPSRGGAADRTRR